jgi:DMSO/TMAO reductase YedYZ molybdopterin-dependent catalytic subunit
MSEQPEPSEEAAVEAPEVRPEVADEDAEAEREMRRLSRRSFLWAAGAVVGTGTGLYAFNKYAPLTDGIKTPFRRALEFNEAVAQRLFFSQRHRAQEYPRSYARVPRNNYHSETPVIDPETWRLRLDGLEDTGPQTLALSEIRASAPRVEQTTELKCVEGWSCIVTWAGVRFVDFAKRYPPPPGTRYVEMRSEPADFPGARYYIGLDLASCLHPQTLLAYEMNGAPLDAAHGTPLRLAMPHKYGIKNIKLITSIAYRRDRPADFWHEQGYDYYAGL